MPSGRTTLIEGTVLRNGGDRCMLSIPDSITDVLLHYPGPNGDDRWWPSANSPSGWPSETEWPLLPWPGGKDTRPAKWPSEVTWPPDSNWPPDPLWLAGRVYERLTGQVAQFMALAAMRRVEERLSQINDAVARDNLHKQPGDQLPAIRWSNQVATVLGVHHGTLSRWRETPWSMGFGDFCRLALVFSLRLEDMPSPTEDEAFDSAYTVAVNWLLEFACPGTDPVDILAIHRWRAGKESSFTEDQIDLYEVLLDLILLLPPVDPLGDDAV
jgi:hypothetical protein